MDIQNTLEFAIDLSRKTGQLLRHSFQQTKQISYKSSPIDPVTQFDEAAEKLLTDHINERFPDHHVVAEEGTNSSGSSNYRWHIDPLDGTVNFAHGFPQFCVSLALYEGDKPLIGVVYDPMRDECFYAMAGDGAYLNGRRLRVSETDDLLHSLLATGYPYDKHTSELDNLKETAIMLKACQGLRRAGSAALDIAYVAAGRLDGYWEYKLNSWDVAAATLLVTEAGGQVTMIDGEPFVLNSQCHLIVSNGRVHQQMADLLN